MILARMLRPPVQMVVTAVSHDRVVGEDAGAANEVATHLRRLGYEVTPAYWNEDGEAPRSVAAHYASALPIAGGVGVRTYVSIKAPAIGCDIVIYHGLLAQAGTRGVALHLDALGPEHADATLALLECPPVSAELQTGCTLPGRWRRSLDDAERLAGLGVPIRVVKGEWAADADAEPAGGFMDVVHRLAGREAAVRVATHDPALAWQAVRILRRAGTPCELELLYGFPVRRVLPRLQGLAVPIRVYLPFGHGWVPYCMSRVREHPALMPGLVLDALSGRYPDGFPRLTSVNASEGTPTQGPPRRTGN